MGLFWLAGHSLPTPALCDQAFYTLNMALVSSSLISPYYVDVKTDWNEDLIRKIAKRNSFLYSQIKFLKDKINNLKVATLGKSRWLLGYDGGDLEMRFSCPYYCLAAFMPNGYYWFDLLLLYCLDTAHCDLRFLYYIFVGIPDYTFISKLRNWFNLFCSRIKFKV